MQEIYNPKKIEKYVQDIWDQYNTFQVLADERKEKYYCVAMLPYPSGNLHMGHVRNYTISDVIARYQRMLGKNVLHPIGWDAFGLPAEEAAIKNNIPPATWTYANIKNMKKQLKSLGFSYDWSREITTCKPDYYHWEQWFFIKLYKKKLIYKKMSSVNWCPTDNTVLANEQVINGCCWRCNSTVIIRNIPQWFIKITKYAKELLNDIKKLKYWPKKIKNMQKNWIGYSKGVEIIFNVCNMQTTLKIYTTRPDFIMGATFVSISPFHSFIQKISTTNKEIKTFIDNTCNIMHSNASIHSVKNLGKNTQHYVIHPFNKKKLPIWINNHLLIEHGVDISLSTPAHNQRDLDFAIRYHLQVIPVILKLNNDVPIIKSIAMTEKGKLFNSKEFNDLNHQEACKIIIKKIEKQGIGKKKINYKLQDWTISRQRYWGTPIPMAKTKNGNIIPIPNDQLPVILPENKTIQEIKNISQTLQWQKINIHNELAYKENDTLDTFIESSWYYIRYTDPNFKGMINSQLANYWLPIDQYIGGIEHATMHLIYIRFYHKLLRDFGFVNSDEPVKKLLCQGMVLSDAFYYMNNNIREWIAPSSVRIKKNAHGDIINAETQNGETAIYAGMIKMSKSKKNGVEPDKIIKKYGADTVRLFMMFAAPVETSLEWKESGIKGVHRFLQKLWKLIYLHTKNNNEIIDLHINDLTEQQKYLRCKLHQTILKVTDDIDRRQTFNTAISEIMKLVNLLIKKNIDNIQDIALMQESLLIITKLLYPFTPHFSFIAWKKLTKNQSNIDNTMWPLPDQKAIIEENTNIAIQINGKTRCILSVKKDILQDEIIDYAKQKTIIMKYLQYSKINKIIYISNKILNIIIN
ncbi:MAG TPA: leucine--tRNA ligase [Buchnera sp. (in: enterobacteria)]|nr:leucine--tRNA ligase [Buchnera sp. (in: enterobacteria)]